jgi:2-dehydropantoate 2-reductase
MRVLIVGTGSLGCFYGAKLQIEGHDVHFIARGEMADAIYARGIEIQWTDRSENSGPCKVVRDPSSLTSDFDVVFVTVKARQLHDVGPIVARAVARDGYVIPLQNGLDSEDIMALYVGKERVIGGVAYISVGKVGPGQIYCRQGGNIALAPYGINPIEPVYAVAKVLSPAFVCKVHARLDQILWEKLLFNSPFNAICALTRITAGRVLELPRLHALVVDTMKEVQAVARAEGVTIAPSAVDFMLDLTRGPAHTTEPSMLQDVLMGRPTEAFDIHGSVINRAQKHGVPVPIHELFYALLTAFEPPIDEGYVKYKSTFTKLPALEETALLRELLAKRQAIYARGWIGLYPNGIGFGNVSVRESADTFVITANATGGLAHLEIEHLTRVTAIDARQNHVHCEGPRPASSESMTHAVIYQRLPAVGAVVHIHCRPLWQKLLHQVPTTRDDVAYGTPDMCFEVQRILLDERHIELGVFVMGGHEEGIVSFGRTLDEAFKRLVDLVGR